MWRIGILKLLILSNLILESALELLHPKSNKRKLKKESAEVKSKKRVKERNPKLITPPTSQNTDRYASSEEDEGLLACLRILCIPVLMLVESYQSNVLNNNIWFQFSIVKLEML